MSPGYPISIIIPVYNVAPYVEKCFRSVMNQTMAEGVECIIVDDCGQDNSMEIVERLVEEYHGNIYFRILHHEHNRGLSAARNTGIDAAKGDYVYFLDSDDWIIPECIELLVNCLNKYPDSQIVFAGAESTNENYGWLDYTKKQLQDYSKDRARLQLSMLRRFDFGMTVWNKLIAREFIISNGLYFVEGIIHEDEVWNFEASKYIQSASFVKHNTYIYNIHDNSIATNSNDEIRWERLSKLWLVLMLKLECGNKQLYIKAISNFIIEKTRWDFPWKHKKYLCVLFLKLSWRSCGILSIPLLIQGLLALCLPSKYPNQYTCSRLML